MPQPRLFWTRSVAAAVLCAGLGACGYKPLYGSAPTGSKTASLSSDLARVQIVPIADRSGQLLYNHLKDEMHPRGEAASPTHRLTIRLRELKQDLGIRSDAQATRGNLILIARVRLDEAESGRTVFTTVEQTVVSYNILIDNRYSTTITERRSRRTGLETLAEQISRRVALFMNRRRSVQTGSRR